MRTRLTLMVYDVASDGRRGRLHRLLEQYGVAVQKSAFEARLGLADRRHLLRLVEGLLDPKEDRFALYVIGPAQEQHIAVIGDSRPIIEEQKWFSV